MIEELYQFGLAGLMGAILVVIHARLLQHFDSSLVRMIELHREDMLRLSSMVSDRFLDHSRSLENIAEEIRDIRRGLR